jgi:hypothetical protein
MSAGAALPGSRRQLFALAALFAAIVAVRLLAVYPPTLRHDPAHIALQACRILDGERPLFWSGQAWMGSALTYVEAACFAVFGKSTLVMSVYAWCCSAAWVGLSLALAWRFFGPRAALLSAAFWVVPSAPMLYWASQARGDFHALFIATPAILLLAHDLARRHAAGLDSRWRTAFFGLVCGFAFWQNMAIGPCLVVTFVVLMAQLRRRFWTQFVWWYSPAWLIGFGPVLLYNARNGWPLLHQGGGLQAPAAAARAVAAFAGNALPAFWGLSLQGGARTVRGALALAFLLWAAAVFALALARAVRGAASREERLALQLALGLVGLQLVVIFATGYGKSLATRANPSLFFFSLWSVVPAILAAALVGDGPPQRWPRRALAAPLAILLALNLPAPWAQAERLAEAWRDPGPVVRTFPDPANRMVAALKSAGLSNGYLEDSLRSVALTLAGLGSVEVARPFAERVVEYSLRADAAERFFWVSGGGVGAGVFAPLGVTFASLGKRGREVFHAFRRAERAESLIEGFELQVSQGQRDAGLMVDRRVGTSWALPQPLPEAWLRFDFRRAEPVSSITLLPRDSGGVPNHLVVQRSADGVAWETAAEWRSVGPVFWSVRHPFLKVIKPRCELVLPAPRPARFLRLLVPAQRGRLDLREVYVAREDAAPPAPVALDDELAAIDRELAPLKATHQVAGDHWFMSALALRGFGVEFLPNRCVDNAGRRNPFLAADLPLDFSRPLALIVPAAHAGSVAHDLERARVPHRLSAHQRYTVFVTGPARVPVARYWSGFDLLETARAAP